MEWTDNQKKAIKSKGNTIVTAAAGSGKTAVLVERVIEKLCDEKNPVSADRLLIVTFTNAAAAEMRQRIEKALADKCTEQPNNEFLLRQRLLISSADICTIDSFCIRLVRNYFSLLGISPDFKIADEVTDLGIKYGVLKKIFNELFEKNDTDFLEFLEASNSEYGTANAEKNILQIYSFCQKLPQGFKWLKECAENYNPANLKNSIYYNIFFEDVFNKTNLYLTELKAFRRDLFSHEKTDLKYGKYFDDLIEYLSKLSAYAEKLKWDDISNLLGNLPNFIGRFAYSKNYDRELFDRGSEIYKSAKFFIINTAKMFSMSFCELEKEFEFYYRIVLQIYDIVVAFNEVYIEQLHKKSYMTFALVELYALKLLTKEDEQGNLISSDLSNELISMYDEIMVDEYQDINDLQGTLFEILSDGSKKLFTVGDVKQSIYGFRGSNPENFSKRSDIAKEYSDDLSADILKRIVLSNNFRSREKICDFINSFFTVCMSKEGAGIEYDSDEMLYPLAKFPDNSTSAVEGYLISATEEISNYQAEAIFFADYVEKTVKKPAFLRDDKDGRSLRKAEYGDIALLLRSYSHMDAYVKELKKRNIPVSVGGGNFFETTEILTVISLIKAVENPMDDIAMLSTMLSPVFGFSENDAAFLKAEYRGKKLYSGILKEAEKNNEKCRLLKEKISAWRKCAACDTTPSFVSYLLIDSGYSNIVLSMSDPERRQGNLYLLEQFAESYFTETSGDLKGFISYLTYLEEISNTTSVSGSSANAVLITTMHKSKGLQFPITVLGGLGSKFSNLDIINDFLINEKLGLAFKFVDDEANVKEENFAVSILKTAMKEKQIEEEMRLLYVAMTRAEEKLVMLLCVDKGFKSKLNERVSFIENNFDEDGRMNTSAVKSASGYYDWLLPSLLQTPSGREFLRANGEELHKCSKLFLESDIFVEYKEIALPEELPSSHKSNDTQVDLKLKEELTDIFEYDYEYRELNEIEIKTSVSELTKRKADREFAVTSKPAFLSSGGLTPTERGTALHKFMQYADFEKVNVDINGEIDRLYEFEYLSLSEADSIEIEKVEKFVQSDLFKRILASDKLFREQRFLLDVKAGDIYENLSEKAKNQTVIVQGAIDCMFIEGNHIVLLDFKTDRTNNEEFLIGHYSEQLKTYCVAAEKMFSRPVTECYIYSLYMGKTIKIN